MSAYNIIIMQ
jgi:hypothetical protein